MSDERTTDQMRLWGEWLRWLSDREADPATVPMRLARIEAERTYRRGYQQGFVAALDALDHDGRLHHFAHVRLHGWRYGEATVEARPPAAPSV